jgi:hypothetical protein
MEIGSNNLRRDLSAQGAANLIATAIEDRPDVIEELRDFQCPPKLAERLERAYEKDSPISIADRHEAESDYAISFFKYLFSRSAPNTRNISGDLVDLIAMKKLFTITPADRKRLAKSDALRPDYNEVTQTGYLNSTLRDIQELAGQYAHQH